MGFTKEQLLASLQERQIDFFQHDHPVISSSDEQAKYVGHLKGALSKNLFLKDKKHRYYIVSALADAKVDLKVLSRRLGLGKGILQEAPEEVPEILKVTRGCVTPFALVNESARHVSLLLDQGFKAHERCFFLPLSNDMTISLNVSDLDKFLKSIGKEPAYVDFEANPPVGKDQPPDLATLVPSNAGVPLDSSEKATSLEAPVKNHVPVNNKPAAMKVKAVKSSNDSQKKKASDVVNLSSSFNDPEKLVEEILEKMSAVVLSEIKEENIKQHGEQLGVMVSNGIKEQLSLELKNLATIFKNTAYTEGFNAGVQHVKLLMNGL